VTTLSYEPAFQQVRTITDPAGRTVTSTYDAAGNRTRVDYPDVTVGAAAPQSAHASWTYNAHGQPLTFTDAEGRVTAYAYYDSGPANGYRRSVTLDQGGENLTTTYEYDAAGHVTAVADPRGVRTEYAVNALGQVVKRTRDAGGLGYETLYWYDANDNLVRRDVENVIPDLDAGAHLAGTHSRDGDNPWFTTTYVYDLLDNLVERQEEVDGTTQATTTYRYDALERLVSVTYPAGNRDEYAYDARGLRTGETRGAGAAEASARVYEYDGNGNLARMADGEGNPTDFVYDGFDRRVGQVDALGNITRLRLDANGNVTELSRLDGQDGRNPGRQFGAAGAVLLSREETRYDERNRAYLIRSQYFSADVETGVLTPITSDGDGDGWVETLFRYDRNNLVTARVDDNGNADAYVYDGLNRLSRRTDALNNQTAYAYDGAGNLTQVTATDRQPDGLRPDETYTTAYAYDGANRLVTVTDSLGQSSHFAYDSRDNQVFREDALGNTTLYAYDGLSRPVEQTRHLRAGGVGGGAVTGQAVTAYAYDGNGNLTSVTDPNGNRTGYAYDALDRLVTVTYADGTSATYAYDRADNRVRETDPNGSVMVHAYDDLNRRVRSQVTQGADVTGSTLQTFAYDGLSRLIQATDDNDPDAAGDDSVLAFGYDSLDNLRRESQDGRTVASAYDGLGNRLSLVYPVAGFRAGSGGETLTATYDALNRVKTLSDGDGQLAAYDYMGSRRLLRRSDGNGTYVAYGYDGARRLTEVSYRRQAGDALVTGFSVTRDAVGNILSETAQPGDVQTAYAYDSLYRLTGYQRPGLDQAFVYDAAGNRTQESRNGQVTAYAVDVMNRYTSVGGVSRRYDANGNLTWDGVHAYGYDAWNRLVRVSTETPPPPSRRLYLPLVKNQGGGLAGAAMSTPAAPPPAEPVLHAYDALNRRVRRQAGSEVVRYLYDGVRVIQELDGGGAPLAAYAGDLLMERGGERSYYQRDAQASVRGLADGAGAVVERVDYEAFGQPRFAGDASASARGNPNLWRGWRYDAGDGLYVLGGLRYEPGAGRGLQP
jgi:YD repeat-containing protein